MIDEISRYGNGQEDQMALSFLRTLNSMFERGILSREHVTSGEGPILQRMSQGYQFFSSWCGDVIANGMLIHLHVYLILTKEKRASDST